MQQALPGVEPPRLRGVVSPSWQTSPVSSPATSPDRLSVAALFAGIGGIELGLQRAGHHADMLCERWEPAKAVLRAWFPDVPLHGDVRELVQLPHVDIVTAGFPCTDLSQAGRTAGITGAQSGLVGEVFRLLRKADPRWVILENVRNMLPLDGGRAMRYLVDQLEALGYRWAYRTVDSRFTGVPQRRHRVLVVASRTEDPRSALLVDDAWEPSTERLRSDAFGFYWTEGLRGLGWAQDATPPLKGGSTIGIPSPPAVWLPGAERGRRLVVPSLEDAEQLQGFPAGWTRPAGTEGRARGPRWKLVGNAVTVGVAEWLGERLRAPGDYDSSRDEALRPGARWPSAAWGGEGRAYVSSASFWPRHDRYHHLADVMDRNAAVALSHRATLGFLDRASRGSLRFNEEFLLDVKDHVEATAGK